MLFRKTYNSTVTVVIDCSCCRKMAHEYTEIVFKRFKQKGQEVKFGNYARLQYILIKITKLQTNFKTKYINHE